MARAQVMLDKGDVKGAMRELERLNGPSADAARPWMNNATGYVVADQSSDELTQGMLQEVSSGTGSAASSVDELMNMIKGIGVSSTPYVSPALY